MADCGCSAGEVETTAQRRTLWLALVLNAAMFVVETGFGLRFSSAALVADGLDMLSDASVYGIALLAIGRSLAFKARSASFSGIMLLVLGLGLIAEVARRFWYGAAPGGMAMIVVSLLALAVNAAVLRLLARHRDQGVHMRATWIFTRADVLANIAVILAGLAVLATGSRAFDLVVGLAIGAYVVREALEILQEAREAGRAARMADV